MKKIIILSFIFVFSFLFAINVFALEVSNYPIAGGCTANGGVSAIVEAVDGTIYVGGSFTTFCGQPRNRIAAIDSDGNLLDWNPNANNDVSTIALNGSTIYAGGSFTSIGGQSRSRIAALDATTGLATSWNPNAIAGPVATIAVSGSTVYVGGNFLAIGGQGRSRIAALDATTGLATSWNPNTITGTVRYLAVDGSIVYAGGSFTSIGGQSRNYIAALDATTGLATSWNPDPNSFIGYGVFYIAIDNSVVYVGGDFDTTGGQSRNTFAALDATTGLATSWNPNANSYPYSITVSGSTIYAGGTFTSIGGQTRNRISALDATTGLATSWNPNANNIVYSVAVTSTKIYIGGLFTTIGGASYPYFATFSANPVPTTTSITPTERISGDTQFTLTVTGTNFVTDSVVNWNGTSLATTYVSSTQLTATVSTSNIATDGAISVTVFNPTPGGGTSNSQTFNVNAPAAVPLQFVSNYAGGSSYIPPVITPSTSSGQANTNILCFTGEVFNTTTGLRCTTWEENPSTGSGQVTYNFGNITLRLGSKGEAVKELQRFLNDKLNLSLVIDGKLGFKTIAVIKQWQKDHGLVPDGLVGKKTKDMMNRN